MLLRFPGLLLGEEAGGECETGGRPPLPLTHSFAAVPFAGAVPMRGSGGMASDVGNGLQPQSQVLYPQAACEPCAHPRARQRHGEAGRNTSITCCWALLSRRGLFGVLGACGHWDFLSCWEKLRRRQVACLHPALTLLPAPMLFSSFLSKAQPETCTER